MIKCLSFGDLVSPYFTSKKEKTLKRWSKWMKEDLVKKRKSLGFDVRNCEIKTFLEIRITGEVIDLNKVKNI